MAPPRKRRAKHDDAAIADGIRLLSMHLANLSAKIRGRLSDEAGNTAEGWQDAYKSLPGKERPQEIIDVVIYWLEKRQFPDQGPMLSYWLAGLAWDAVTCPSEELSKKLPKIIDEAMWARRAVHDVAPKRKPTVTQIEAAMVKKTKRRSDELRVKAVYALLSNGTNTAVTADRGEGLRDPLAEIIKKRRPRS